MRMPGLAAAVFLMGAGACDGQDQAVDNRADVSVAQPRHVAGTGPRVVIDAAHANFHTAEGRYAPFAGLLRNDGYRVESGRSPFDDTSLAAVDVLVIANADGGAESPAFTASEIAAVQRFVENGGGLFLIVDHIPFPAAAQPLARAFGVTLIDNFVEDDGSGAFTRDNGGLTDDPLLVGIDRIRSFSGSSLTTDDPSARPILRIPAGWTAQTMQGSGLSAKTSAEGQLQGVVLSRGRGRVAVFSEAGMFTAQTQGRFRGAMGFNARGAEQNRLLARHIVAWLSGTSDGEPQATP